MQETHSGCLIESYCWQVETCTQMALKCLETDSQKRPKLDEIINNLNEIKNYIDQVIITFYIEYCYGTLVSYLPSCTTHNNNNNDEAFQSQDVQHTTTIFFTIVTADMPPPLQIGYL